MSYYESSYRELQIELKNRGIKASGKTAELIQRLEDSDANGYVDQAKVEMEEEINRNTKLFHVKTMVGSWYSIRLSNNQTISDLLEEIYNQTGLPIDQIRLTAQNGIILTNDIQVSQFDFPEIFLDMMISLRSRRR